MINNKLEDNSTHLYLYKNFYKYNKSFQIEMNFRVELFDKEEHKFVLTLPYTSYPDYYISFYLKGKDPKYNTITRTIRNGTNINIIASFPEGYTDNTTIQTFSFLIDDEKKDFYVYFKREGNIQDNKKFIYFPYKSLINKEYTIINSSNIKELVKQDPIVYYSPYCVKFLKIIPDIKFIPVKTEIGVYINGLKIIIFLKEFNNFWVPNSDKFGDERAFDDYKILDIVKENINEASDRICNIFNNIRSKSKYLLFYLNYKYNQIKIMDKKELNYYGDFFDFIYWLISDNESLSDKINKLESLFSKMDESILKRFLPLLNNINIMINDDIKKEDKRNKDKEKEEGKVQKDKEEEKEKEDKSKGKKSKEKKNKKEKRNY